MEGATRKLKDQERKASCQSKGDTAKASPKGLKGFESSTHSRDITSSAAQGKPQIRAVVAGIDRV